MRRSTAWNVAAAFLSGFRWFRRLYGGHWENWWVDPATTTMWIPVSECTQGKDARDDGIRPPACMGRPDCEHYGGGRPPR